MNHGDYNVHTISDSDDSIVIIEHNQTNDDSHNYASSPEEPAFFRQVIQRVYDLYNLVISS